MPWNATFRRGLAPLQIRRGARLKVTVGTPKVQIKTSLVGRHQHDDIYYRKEVVDQKFEEFAPDLTPIENQLNTHVGDINNPHSVTKSQVGLWNADNTSDADKPISTATQTALDLKASITLLSSEITALIGWAPTDANTLKKLNDKILGIQTLLNSDNISLDSVQELVDAIETIQISLSTILVNDLTTGGITKALTAQQWVVLKGLIDSLSTTVAGKQATLVSGTNIKTLNGNSLLGSGNLDLAPVAGNEWNIQYKKGAVQAWEDNFFYDDVIKSADLYASLGSEKVSTATLGSGWTQDATNYKKSSNGTATLTIATNTVFWEFWRVVIWITGLTVWSVTITLWGVTLATVSANGTYTYRVRALTTASLVFTPTNTARFDITKATLSYKKFLGWDWNVWGKGNFWDKMTVSKTSNNYYPDTDHHSEFHNPSGSYSHHVNRFWSVIKSALSAISDGTYKIAMTSTTGLILSYGWSITGLSDYANIWWDGMRHRWYWQFAWKISAGNQYSNLPSKLDIWGSEMKMAQVIDTQDYTLDDDCIYLFDTTNATRCTGTPTTPCSSYWTNQSVCETHAELGCSFVIQYYCSDFNWNPSNCSSMWCSVETSSCSPWSSDSTTCTNQNSPYGWDCTYNYNSQDCSIFWETDCNNNTANWCSVNTSQCSPSTYNCAQHGSESACNEQSANWCSPNYFPCWDYNNNESGCNEQSANWCSYNTETNICWGWNFTACWGWNFSCNGGGNCSSQGNETDCNNTYYFSSCGGYISYYTCDGNWITGNCNWWAYGLCSGNAGCGSVVQWRCNSSDNPGCNWTTTLNIYLPNSNTFFTNVGSLNRGMTRDYKNAVIGWGSVTLTTKWNDTFEDGTTTKTLTNGWKYGQFFFAIKGNCTDFNGSESQCQSNSGCSPSYDENSAYTGCSWDYQKYKKWYVTTLT